MRDTPVAPRSPLAGLLRRGVLATPERIPVHRWLDGLERRVEARALGGGVPRDRFVRLHTHLRATVPLGGHDPQRAAADNLELVLDACAAVTADPFLISHAEGGESRLGVEASAWARALAALTDHAPAPTYIEYDASGVDGRRIELLARVPLSELERLDSLAVFQYRLDRRSGAVIGPEVACHLDRWDRQGARLRTATSNLRATDIPTDGDQPTVTVKVAARELRTYPAFVEPPFDEPTFPVDVVYLWVDGNDPGWQRRRAERLRELGAVHELAIAPSRFRDYGELRYSFRSLRQHAPWVRHIYLVTDGQRPTWLVDQHPDLTVVDHRDIFTDASWLPSYNSHAISTQLHHIDGLAEHYLVMNDDLLLTRPLSPELFFDANGVAKFALSKATIPAGPIRADDLPHEAARMRARDLVAERYGRVVTRAFLHTPMAQVRSWQEELEQRYEAAYHRTAAQPFRSVSDLEVVSWLHHYAGYYERRTRPERIPYDYFYVASRAGLDRMERVLRDTQAVCVCLNDGDDGDAPLEERVDRIGRFLETVYPEPCDLER